MSAFIVLMSRITGPFHDKFWITARVKRVIREEGYSFLVASAEVYDSHPSKGQPYRASFGSELRAGDPLDMLQNAERIARDAIRDNLSKLL